MISKQDILDRAAEWNLRPEIVEKDYVLGWLLAGIASLPFGQHWIFKGGTSIKKCYLETYRFSEDLDFSLLADAAYSHDALEGNLRTLAEHVAELSGLQFPADAITLRARRNRQGQETFEGRMGYRGPLSYPGTPKILFDLTKHEPVLDPPAARDILHPYPDELPTLSGVQAYSFNELLAEKVRALFERARPRDLYDVVHLLENAPQQLNLTAVRGLFNRKCESKAFVTPTSQQLVATVTGNEEMRSEWANMLAHQLPALPELDGMLVKLPGLLAWVDAEAVPVLPEARLVAAPAPTGGQRIVARGIQYRGDNLPLETIRFAGSNRLLVEFDYHGRHRVAEPYSVWQSAGTGNVLLSARETTDTHVKSFKVEEMRNVRATGKAFSPRYQVEFSETGPVVQASTPRSRTATARTFGNRRISSGGPKYVFECPYCQKKFTHSTNNSTLRAHKRNDGWGDCPGRRGHLLVVR